MTVIVSGQPRAVLLDTCFLIFLNFGQPLKNAVLDILKAAGNQDGVFVSPISAWEVGLMSGKAKQPLIFLPDVKTWFENILAAPTIREASFSSDLAMDAACLPPPIHKDPADRFLIATARRLKVPIITRDRMILDYAAAGHVDAIAC